MELTRIERVLLINQYEILKRLDEGEERHHEQQIDILRNGYKTFYSELAEWVSDDMSLDASKLVIDVLTLYAWIERYKEDHPDDKDIETHSWSSFMGFDGNNESEYMGFAQFLVEKQGKFGEQRAQLETDGFNSHTESVRKYVRMIEAWKCILDKHGDVHDRYVLAQDEVREILDS